MERVGIPQLFDETYLNNNSIMGKYSWDVFKKYLRNENRFHSKYINLEILESVLKETEAIIPSGTKFYRARVSGKKGYSRKEMWHHQMMSLRREELIQKDKVVCTCVVIRKQQ